MVAIMVASEDCAEKGGASYGHYAQALEKVGKLKHIRLSDELTNQSLHSFRGRQP